MEIYSRRDALTGEEEHVAYNLDRYRYYQVIVNEYDAIKGEYDILICSRAYLYTTEPASKFINYNGKTIYRVHKLLSELSTADIKAILKYIPIRLLERALGLAIVDLYTKNKRIKSQRFKDLVRDYDYYKNLYEV